MKTEYLSIVGEAQSTIIIEKSKFICYVSHVEDEEEAKAFVEKIRKQNSLATHNCYAYIADELGLIQKFSDDGEPQGTAGMPMLEVLKNKNLFKVCAVVTRYFGGIKLGAGGLVRAYSKSVSDGVESGKVTTFALSYISSLTLSYDQYPIFCKFVEKSGIKVLSVDFENDCKVKVVIKKQDYLKAQESISNLFKGKVALVKEKEDYFSL